MIYIGSRTFSGRALQNYLHFLDRNTRIEKRSNSDDKAREIVNRWVHGDSLYILPVRRKILLIREMIYGITGTADERAILALLRGAIDTEFSTIVKKIGQQVIEAEFQGENRRKLDQLLTARLSGRKQRGSVETFEGEIVLRLQQRFTANAESANRLNCILIVRELAPQLFASDPQLAQRVHTELGRLTGGNLKMTELGKVFSELGLARKYVESRFQNGNGEQEPTTMRGSAWDRIMKMIGDRQGWHIFGMAMFDGYHSVMVLVDNRPDGCQLYWADQWRIEPGDNFYQEAGSVSGFRRYEKVGFDRFITEKTNQWWNHVFHEQGKRYKASLHLWKFRSRL